MLESFHFMQAFKIAQLEEMVWGRIPQEKEKIIKSLLSHCNHVLLSQ